MLQIFHIFKQKLMKFKFFAWASIYAGYPFKSEFRTYNKALIVNSDKFLLEAFQENSYLVIILIYIIKSILIKSRNSTYLEKTIYLWHLIFLKILVFDWPTKIPENLFGLEKFHMNIWITDPLSLNIWMTQTTQDISTQSKPLIAE